VQLINLALVAVKQLLQTSVTYRFAHRNYDFGGGLELSTQNEI
jgi:hypothetical protein